MDREFYFLNGQKTFYNHATCYALAVWQCGLEEETGLSEGSCVSYRVKEQQL